MTEQELRDLYNQTNTQENIVEYGLEQKQENFMPKDFDQNNGNPEDQKNKVEEQQEEVKTEEENVTNNAEEEQQEEVKTEEPPKQEVKTLEDVYKTIDYIEQTRLKNAQEQQALALKQKQEEDARTKAEEEKNKPFESVLKDFNHKYDYTEEEKKRINEIEGVYGSDLNDYVNLRIKPYENKLVEMIKFIEKNNREDLTKSIYQYHNDLNGRISSQEEYVRGLREKEERVKLEESANKVREEHPDFEDQSIRQNLVKWIYEEQTDAIDQQNLVNLSKSANPKHVIELFDRFKNAKGIAKQVNTQANDKEVQEQARAKADAEREKIAKGMSSNKPVKTTQVDKGQKTLEDLYKAMKV